MELTLGALARALEGARPGIHHSDQGLQYAAAGYVALLKENGARPSMAAWDAVHGRAQYYVQPGHPLNLALAK